MNNLVPDRPAGLGVMGSTGRKALCLVKRKDESGSGTMAKEAWGRVRDELLKELGNNNFVTWIEPLEFANLKGSVAHFSAQFKNATGLTPTSFQRILNKRRAFQQAEL